MRIAIFTNDLGCHGATSSIQLITKGLDARGHTVKVLEIPGVLRSCPKWPKQIDIAVIYNLTPLNKLSVADHYFGIKPIWEISCGDANYAAWSQCSKPFYAEEYALKLKGIIVKSKTESIKASAFFKRNKKAIHIVPHGVEVPTLLVQKTPTNEVTFGYAGRLEYFNNIGALINAFKDLGINYPSARLTIAGDGPRLEPLKQLASNYGCFINFVGRLPHEEMPLFLSKLDVFVMPKSHIAGSNATLEAMAQGVPVIVPGGQGDAERVIPGVTGFVYNLLDSSALSYAISYVFNKTAEERQQMGQMAYAKARAEFSVELLAERLESVFVNSRAISTTSTSKPTV